MLKKVWSTAQENSEYRTISLESEHPASHRRMCAEEIFIPKEPTPEKPLRHIIILGIFTQDDTNKLAQLLDTIRDDKL